MMINTRSAAAFSITRLRAIQKWQAKKFGQAHLSERKSADMPCTLFKGSFGDQSAPVQKSTTRTTLKAAYVGLSSSSIEWWDWWWGA